MNEGLVDIAKLRKHKMWAAFRGKSAYCFIKGNKLIKVYANSNDRGYIPLDRNSIVDLSVFQSDTIVFPDEYLYEYGQKAGEIMNYITDDIIIFSLKNKTKIEPFIENYENALNDIMIYSNLVMRDLCSANILYSEKNGFHIIDTTEWEFSRDDSNRFNTFRFNSYLIKTILEYIELDITYYYNYPMIDENIKKNAYRYGNTGKVFYKELEKCFHNKNNLLGLLYASMSLYQKYKSEELKTLDDIKEMTKMLKKG